MEHMLFYSSNSSARIYHDYYCRYAQRMNRIYMNHASAGRLKRLGYRPCKCCSAMKFRIKREAEELDQYCKKKHMEYKIKDDILYVRTEIGFWKLYYRIEDQKFSLYHGNKSGEPVPADSIETESYHRQSDKPSSITLMDAFIYISKHDQFRKAEKAAGGDIRGIQIDKKYRKSAERRAYRSSKIRVNDLFKMLESENEGLRELSYC